MDSPFEYILKGGNCICRYLALALGQVRWTNISKSDKDVINSLAGNQQCKSSTIVLLIERTGTFMGSAERVKYDLMNECAAGL